MGCWEEVDSFTHRGLTSRLYTDLRCRSRDNDIIYGLRKTDDKYYDKEDDTKSYSIDYFVNNMYRAKFKGTIKKDDEEANHTIKCAAITGFNQTKDYRMGYDIGVYGTIYLEKYVPEPPSTPVSISVPSQLKSGGVLC